MTHPALTRFPTIPLAAALALGMLLTAGAARAQTVVTVNQTGSSFVPKDVVIQPGDKVRWLWSSGVHDVLEGTDASIDASDGFYGTLTSGTPVYAFTFQPKFLFEYPRPGNIYHYLSSPDFGSGMVGTVTVQSQWISLLSALPGTLGAPLLWGAGDAAPGTGNAVVLENAAPSSPMLLFAGLTQGNVPFKGGTLVPIPYVVLISLVTDLSGGVVLPFSWPMGLSGTNVYMQAAIVDAGAPQGVALSNALRVTGA